MNRELKQEWQLQLQKRHFKSELALLQMFKCSGLSESCEVDCWVVKVSGQSRDILLKKTPSVKKCQAE